MGRPLSARLADLPGEDRALLDAHTAAPRRAGLSAVPFASKPPRDCVAEGTGASTLGNRLVGALNAGEQHDAPLPVVGDPRVADFSDPAAEPTGGPP
jgi:hypothetical protein